MSRPSRVRVKGPLEPYVDGFRQQLAGQGYSPWTATAHMQLMARVSCWLAAHRLGADALTAASVESFLQDRRASGQARRLSPRGLIPLLDYLRGLGVAPEPTPPVPQSPLGQLLDGFAVYLVAERGLAQATVISYRSVAARFLDGRSPAHGVDLGELTAGEVSAFVAAECGRRSVGSVNNVVTALRALLRFLHVQGHTATSLATAAPTAPGWRGGGMPRALAAGQVARLLASCDRRTAAGRRDYAILVMLTRLGLRAGEVATLAVDDVDWRAGEILIPGKGNRHELLPLPVDVGQAVADYCQRSRHRGGCRSLFVHVRAPYAALSSSAVSAVVVRACDRAGLPRVGAHRLRHTAAKAMRRAGAPLLRSAKSCGTATSTRPPCTPQTTGTPWRGWRGGGREVRHAPAAQAVDDYLAIRRGLGFKLRDHGPLLADFVDTSTKPEQPPSPPSSRWPGPPSRAACARRGESSG